MTCRREVPKFDFSGWISTGKLLGPIPVDPPKPCGKCAKPLTPKEIVGGCPQCGAINWPKQP